jgi:hypothetical protein
MNQSFETFQKMGKDLADATVKSTAVLTKGVQTVLGEVADQQKKNVEQAAAVFEKLKGVKSFDKFVEIQMDYTKSFYEGVVAQSNKFYDLSSKLSKEALQPYEALSPKASKAA